VTRFDWINRVLSADGPASPTVRLVLVALVWRFYNEKRGYAFPAAATLAERTGQCEKTVRTALESAETAGWLRRDAVPGLVTHYFPTVPENRDLVLTKVGLSGVERQSAPEPRQAVPGTAEPLTYDHGREQGEDQKRPGGPPPCPVCSAPMKAEKSRRTREPMFFGCTRYRSAGCPGKRELDGTDSTPKAALEKAKAERALGVTAAFIDREREHRAKVLAERASQALTDAPGMARRLLGHDRRERA
jgi:hypothetical protein